MTQRLLPALFLYLAALAQVVIFVSSTYALLAAAGGRAQGVSVGFLRVIGFQIGGVKVRWGLLPFGGSVDIAGLAPGDDDMPGGWRRLALGRRLAVLVGPWLLTFALAALCLGPERAVASAGRAVPQMVLTLDMTPLVRAFLGVLASAPFTTVLGIVSAKVAPLNLLPLGTLAGGRILVEIVQALRPSPASEERPSAIWIVASLLFLLSISARLLWGFYRAIS